jgi:hypothetical protein
MTISLWQRLSREAKIGVVAVGSVIVTRVLLGNFVVNDWEGWGTFLGVAVATVIEGLVLGGLIFALFVRLAARSRGARPAVSSVVVGALSVLSLAIPYSAPQVVLGAAAAALGLVALGRGDGQPRSRRLGTVGIVLGSLVIVTWIVFMGVAVATGDWPIGGD